MQRVLSTRFLITCEWGEGALESALDHSEPPPNALIIVDVLSFSTCVDMALAQGAHIYPYFYKDERALTFAREHQAQLVGSRSKTTPSLSPASLRFTSPGEKWVLPSPNGSTLTYRAQEKYPQAAVFTVCFRNALAVAKYIVQRSALKHIHVIAAGERWPQNTLRPAWEDFCGAGAFIHELEKLALQQSASAQLSARLSFEARWARNTFRGCTLAEDLKQCHSGQELIQRGFPEDVDLASAYNSSTVVPQLQRGAYQNQS